MAGLRRRSFYLFVLLAAAAATTSRADDGLYHAGCFTDGVCSLPGCLFSGWLDTHVGGPEEEEKCSYGPSVCEPRKTLMQWSYGTTFSGGPPGMDDRLASDRPDFTEASTTVGRGVVQLETGYTYFSDNQSGTRTTAHSYPEMLWRIGACAEWFEFRVGYNHGSELLQLTNQPRVVTSSDLLYLGIKLGLTPQEAILPEMALVPQMFLPFSTDPAEVTEVLPGLNWLYGWDLESKVVSSIAGSTQINRARDGSDLLYLIAQSMTVGYTFTERVGAYTEWFVLIPSGAAATVGTQHYLDGGLTYLVNNNLQFDIRAGIGLSEASDDFFAGMGLVKRWGPAPETKPKSVSFVPPTAASALALPAAR